MLEIRSIHPQRIKISLFGARQKLRIKSIRKTIQIILSIMSNKSIIFFERWQNVEMDNAASTYIDKMIMMMSKKLNL